jgi:GrpB-like predicted nucleotidyltransferase (UPF0157 family)
MTRQSPTSDEAIAAYTLGEPTRLDAPIELAEYDPAWPALFEHEAARIRRVLGERALRLEHVGSTAVPGLAAKPRLDVLLVVRDSAAEFEYVPALETAGYVLRVREADWHEHRMLHGPDTTLNLHVFSANCGEIERMLAFRDWLRAHADERALYERTKRELAARTWKYVQNYADAKAEVVEQILARALASSRAASPPEKLLFLPGAAGDIRVWQPVAADLSHAGARQFMTWPGLGGVPPDEAITGLDDLVRRVSAAVTEPVVLFGQSMGGLIAVRVALSMPEKVRGLVLSVTSGGIDVGALGAVDWRPAFARENPGTPRWFLDARDDLSDELRRLELPTLLLWGDADPISPVAVGRRLAELLPAAELVVVAGGMHDLVQARAREVLPPIERYLQRVLRRGGSELAAGTRP